jgi:RHS repeat-associated protein
MVKSSIDNVVTIFVNAAYQVVNPGTPAQKITKMYQGGAFRVNGVLYYGLSDHLGSTSITTSASGAKVAETRYKAWGEVRYQSGDSHTDRTYTGQRSYTSDFGLIYYNARWYDSSTGRFAQADTIIPGGVQSLDRYEYVNNNPIMYRDPTGHYADCSKLPSDSRSVCESANQQEHQQAYNDAIGKLGQSISGLDKWSVADLYRLIGWLNRGIKFAISSDPKNAWTSDNLKDVIDGLDYAQALLGNKTDKALGLSNGGTLTFVRHSTGSSTSMGAQGGSASPWNNQIDLTLLSGSNQYAVFTVLHEIGHFVDYNLGVKQFGNSPGWRQAASWSERQWWQFWAPELSLDNDTGVVRQYSVNGGPAEDFADTFAFMAYPNAAMTVDALGGINAFFSAPSTNRQNYITNLLGP